MHVYMKDRLSCCLVYIYADIVTVRMETLTDSLFHILKHNVHSLTLMVSEVEV